MRENELFQRPASYWLRRADRLRQSGDPLRAAVLERHALHAEPTNVDASIRYVLTLRQLKCYEASNREAFRALSQNPDALDLFGLIGLNLKDLGMEDAAYDAVTRYLSQPMPDTQLLPEWHDEAYDLSVLYERKKPPQRRKRVEGLLHIAAIRLAMGDVENARRALDRAEKLPGLEHRREMTEAMYYIRLGDARESMLHLFYAINRAPRNARQHAAVSGMFALMGERKLAYIALCRSLDLARTPEEVQAALTASDTMGAPHLAIGMLRRLHKYQPKNAVLLYDLSLCLLRLGKFEEAERHMRLCRELDPGDNQSEALFQLMQQNEPEAMKALANQFPWHGMTNQTLLDLCVTPVLSMLEEGIEELAHDRHLRSHLFMLLRMQADWPANLLWALAPALEEGEREAFLREVLLQCPDVEQVRRVAVVLLDQMQAQPPYVAWKKGRLVFIDPTQPPKAEPNFRQRFLTRRLHLAHKLCDKDPYFLPWAMETVTKLGRDVQNQIIDDAAHIWPAALAIRYRAIRGMQPLQMSTINRTRAALINRALRLLKMKEEQAHADH